MDIVSQKALGNCNNRLSLLLSRQQKTSATIESLKSMLADQEVEYRKKAIINERFYQETNSKLTKDNDEFHIEIQKLTEQLNVEQNKCNEISARLRSSEIQSTNSLTLAKAKESEISGLKNEYNSLVVLYSDMKFKYDSYTDEKQAMEENVNETKDKMMKINGKLRKKAKDLKEVQKLHTRLMNERENEIVQCQQKIKHLQQGYDACRLEFQQEFDGKLGEFIVKREKQYKDEKEEWMRIFQLEFNRKLHDTKASNKNLRKLNQSLSADVGKLRDRCSNLNGAKVDLEDGNRRLQKEMERLNVKLDIASDLKSKVMQNKDDKILKLKDQCAARKIQFDELAGIKTQLDAEIDLYKEILDKAENDAGYQSPFSAKYGKTDGFHNTRKRRRLNQGISDTTTDINGESDPRASHSSLTAIADYASMAMNNNYNEVKEDSSEVKEEEENCEKRPEILSSSKVNCSVMDEDCSPSTVSLSGLDLNENMIEIRNNGQSESVCLKNYTLTNNDRSCVFLFPDDFMLDAGQVYYVFVGKHVMSSKHRRFLKAQKIRHCLYWLEDVWQGNVDGDVVDVVRMYDADDKLAGKIVVQL